MTKLYEQLLDLQHATTKEDKKNTILSYYEDATFMEVLKFRLDPFDVIGLSTKKLKSDVEANVKYTNISDLLAYLRVHNTGRREDIAIAKGWLNQFDGDEYEFLFGILAKTQTLGVGAKIVNDTLGKGTIADFDVQLAFPFEKKIDRYDDEQEFMVTQKLDGHRCLTMVKPDGSIVSFTRKGQEIDGLNELHEDIAEFVKNNADVLADYPEGIALDGEVLLKNKDNLTTGELFQATSVALKSEGEKHNIEYHLFDIVPLNEFLDQKESNQTYEQRRAVLDELTSGELVSPIDVLARIHKDEIPEWSHYAIKNGWEGVMLNTVEGKYKKTRSPQLLKVKKMHTADLPVIGFTKAETGAFAGTLATVNVQLDEDNIVQVGSGFTEEMRHEIWDNQEKYLNVMVEVQYFEQTSNKKGEKSLRFPVFKQFRFDKTTDDINIE